MEPSLGPGDFQGWLPQVKEMSGSESGLKYRIRVVEGGMGLGLTLVAVPRMIAPDLLVREILDDLERQNIRCGVEVDTITDIVKGRLLAVEMLVARGRRAVRGTSAQIDLLLLPPDSSGDANWIPPALANTRNTLLVKAGDVIARKTPMVPGSDGMNIFGLPVRAPQVKDASLPLGTNTVVSEDGLELRAAIDGQLRWAEGGIAVEPAVARTAAPMPAVAASLSR